MSDYLVFVKAASAVDELDNEGGFPLVRNVTFRTTTRKVVCSFQSPRTSETVEITRAEIETRYPALSGELESLEVNSTEFGDIHDQVHAATQAADRTARVARRAVLHSVMTNNVKRVSDLAPTDRVLVLTGTAGERKEIIKALILAMKEIEPELFAEI
jgi:hypothetical protein